MPGAELGPRGVQMPPLENFGKKYASTGLNSRLQFRAKPSYQNSDQLIMALGMPPLKLTFAPSVHFPALSLVPFYYSYVILIHPIKELYEKRQKGKLKFSMFLFRYTVVFLQLHLAGSDSMPWKLYFDVCVFRMGRNGFFQAFIRWNVHQ